MLATTNEYPVESIFDSVVNPDERLLMEYIEEKERQAQLRDEELTQKFLAEKQSNGE